MEIENIKDYNCYFINDDLAEVVVTTDGKVYQRITTGGKVGNWKRLRVMVPIETENNPTDRGVVNNRVLRNKNEI